MAVQETLQIAMFTHIETVTVHVFAGVFKRLTARGACTSFTTDETGFNQRVILFESLQATSLGTILLLYGLPGTENSPEEI
tara:strand:+ start:1421 stop:1663 length:243 start_codon:yes stop_codon:yes gene_type:complete